VPTVFKSGSLSLLELSGPVQAWNEIALTYCVCGLLYNNILCAFLLAENGKEELEELPNLWIYEGHTCLE